MKCRGEITKDQRARDDKESGKLRPLIFKLYRGISAACMVPLSRSVLVRRPKNSLYFSLHTEYNLC
jgi:hypothetical protein